MVGVGGDEVTRFPCAQWLEECEGCGGKLEVDLEPEGLLDKQKTQRKPEGEGHIYIYTGRQEFPTMMTLASSPLFLSPFFSHYAIKKYLWVCLYAWDDVSVLFS